MRLRVSKKRMRNRTDDVGGEAGEDAADERLAADAVAEVAGEVGNLVDAGGEDDRRREQEREAGRVFVVEPADQAGDHRDAGATDAGEQRADLGDADRAGFFEVEGVESAAFLAFAVGGRVFGDELAAPRPVGGRVHRRAG